mgnify:FL=1
MHSDPIADLLTRIRNAVKAHHQTVEVPYSKIKENILQILKKHNFIEDYTVVKTGQFPMLEITLNEERKELNLRRVSKPGQRIYIKKEQLKQIRSGLGLTIVSTSQGLMTNSEAHRKSLGGELICEVY